MKKREKPVARPKAQKKSDVGIDLETEDSAPFAARAKQPFNTVMQWWIAPLLVALVITVLLFQLAVSQPAISRAETYGTALLGNAAERVTQQLAFLRTRLHVHVANADVIAAFQVPNTEDGSDAPRREALAAAEAAIARTLPEVLGVRLLPLDWHSVEPTAALPITNVTLDALRQARKDGRALPELIGGGKAHVILVEVIKVEKQPIGFLLTGIPATAIEANLQAMNSAPGFMELSQQVGDVELRVAQRGDAALKSDEPTRVLDVAETHWKIKYWEADSENPITVGLLVVYWLGVAIVLAAIAVFGWLLVRALDNLHRLDAQRLTKSLLDAHNSDATIDVNGYHLAVFQDMAVTLARENWRSAPPVSQAPAPTATTAPALRRSAPQEALAAPAETKLTVPAEIFRAYDIRGVVGKTLSVEVVRAIGRAIGSEAFDRGEQKVAVARDGRSSGPELLEALKQGLMESGRDVIDIGAVPTPLLYFATNYLSTRSGVMLTGSHNPAEYNGLKIVIAGETMSGEDIQRLRERIEKGNLLSGRGSQEAINIVDDYLAQITSDVALAQPLKVVIDCGNGIPGMIAPVLMQALGCEVVPLYCEVDGTFPNHHPDPSKPENLKDLIAAVKKHGADVGLAFDGDGDRLGVVDSDGKIIWADRQLMLYAMDVLSRHPGTDIIYDVKCSRHLARVVSGHGGRPLMWRTGHSLIKAKMRETGALLAGECSGHFFFKERWYGFDDGLYAAARLLEILAADFRKSADVFKALPEGFSTPELNVEMADNKKFSYIDRVAKQGQFGGGELTTIDGVRVDFADGWGLVRASNTTPSLVIRFEADTETALKRIQELFRAQLTAVDPAIKLPF